MTNEELTKYSGKHLLYEFQMFKWATLIGPLTHGAMRNAVVECFAIHLRNLIDFFYPPANFQDDDVFAEMFFDAPTGWKHTIPESLKAARCRANKELSHLTKKRKSDDDAGKDWQVGTLFVEVEAVAKKFAAQASEAKLHRNVAAFLAAATTPPTITIGGLSNRTDSVTMFFSSDTVKW